LPSIRGSSINQHFRVVPKIRRVFIRDAGIQIPERERYRTDCPGGYFWGAEWANLAPG
jgi:hypothetical protein